MRHIPFLVLLSYFIIGLTTPVQSEPFGGADYLRSVQDDSVTVKGRVVRFRDKNYCHSFIAFYSDFEDKDNERLADKEIDRSLLVTYAQVDTLSNFTVKLTKGSYIMRIYTFGAGDVTKRISIDGDVVDLGTYDILHLYDTLDGEHAEIEMKQRIYDRVMDYRRAGNPTNYNIINSEDIESAPMSSELVYSNYKRSVNEFKKEHPLADTATVKGIVVDLYDEVNITSSKVIFTNYAKHFADSIADKIKIEANVGMDGNFSCMLPYGYYICTITDPTGKYRENIFTIDINKRVVDMKPRYIDPDAVSRYIPSMTVFATRSENRTWQKDKKNLQKFTIKMKRKYAEMEEALYEKMISMEM